MTEEEATAEGDEMAEEEVEEGNETANATAPEDDTMPALLIGIQAIWGTVVWLLTMFLYLKTNSTDPDLDPSLPFTWFWKNLDSSTVGFAAAMYLSFFFGYLIVSVVELVAWILFKMGNPGFALLWVPLVGFWGSLVLYAFPVVFALLHIVVDVGKGGLGGTSTLPFYTTDLILGCIVGGISWIAAGLIHVLFTGRFVAHAATFVKAECMCDAEAPEELGEDADEDAKAEYDEAVAAYDAACLEQCPPEPVEEEGEEGEEGGEEGGEKEETSEGDGW